MDKKAMKDKAKTKEQLTNELAEMRQRIAELEKLETEYKRTKETLSESEARFRQFFEQEPEYCYMISPEGLMLDVNKAALRALGYRKKDLVGKPVKTVYAPESLAKMRQVFLKWKKTGVLKDEEMVIISKNGERRTVLLSAEAVKGKDGKILHSISVQKDITKRKQAEEKLDHLNAVLRAIRNVNQLITRVKERGKLITGICEEIIETRGYFNAWIVIMDKLGKVEATAEAGLGKGFLPMLEWLKRGELTDCGRRALKQADIVVTEDPPSSCANCPLSSSYSGRGAMTTRLKHERKVYGLLTVSIPANLSGDEEERTLFKEIARDIAFALHGLEVEGERKRAEEELSFKTTLLEAQSETSIDGILVVDNEGKTILFNKRFGEMWNIPQQILDTRSDERMLQSVLNQLKDPDGFLEKVKYLYAHKNEKSRDEIEFKDGKVFDRYSSPLIDSNGKYYGRIWYFRDITERERMEEELKRALAELKRSNAELEQFAYVASHDLQEPLRMVSSYLQLIEKRYKGKLDSDADEFIAFAVDGALQMRALINDLLTYSRLDTRFQPLKSTDCETVLRQVLDNMKISIEETKAKITHDPLPFVMADSYQLVQSFQNLIGNAIKFRSKGPPRVHVSAEKKGNMWVFSVRDNGIGIDPQYAKRIFQIFQRLHGRNKYPGTGIGLAVCKKIAKRHGGDIWMESEPEKGSTFYFSIPVSQRKKS